MCKEYKGYLGCEMDGTVEMIEIVINNYWKLKGSSRTFSATNNSREYFFTNVSQWLMDMIGDNQDYWCNNPDYHRIIEVLPTVHALAYTPAVSKEKINECIATVGNIIIDFGYDS